MENVVRLEDLPEFIEKTIAAVRDGIAMSRDTGVLVDMPEQIQISCTVVKQWQALEVNSESRGSTTQEGDGTRTQEGTTERVGTDTGTTTSEDSNRGTSFRSGSSVTSNYIGS